MTFYIKCADVTTAIDYTSDMTIGDLNDLLPNDNFDEDLYEKLDMPVTSYKDVLVIYKLDKDIDTSIEDSGYCNYDTIDAIEEYYISKEYIAKCIKGFNNNEYYVPQISKSLSNERVYYCKTRILEFIQRCMNVCNLITLENKVNDGDFNNIKLYIDVAPLISIRYNFIVNLLNANYTNAVVNSYNFTGFGGDDENDNDYEYNADEEYESDDCEDNEDLILTYFKNRLI